MSGAKDITIAGAVVEVMRTKGRSLSPAEAYGAIVEANLYNFNSEEPVAIVRTQIRRRCEGLDFPSALSSKLFRATNDGRYTLIDQKAGGVGNEYLPDQGPSLHALLALQQEYDALARDRVLAALKKLTPASFELFAKRLLHAYGFRKVEVTRKSRDGGIDGHGQLPIGLSSVSVAFQCKRYADKAVGREAVDSFRGAISGLHEQGYMFATSRFTMEAVNAQRRAGAVPVVLFDGPKIVDIMFDRSFGVAFRELRIPELALDTILEEA